MNLALPALVILLGLLPGLACFYGYFAGRFERRSAGVSGGEELALYVAFAVPIDSVGYWIGRKTGWELDLDTALHLLSGTMPDAVATRMAIVLREHILMTAAWYLVLLACAVVIGSIARRLVWAFRLDTRFNFLRLRHDWYYVLQGRDKSLPRDVVTLVDVLTTHPQPDNSRLYSGIVSEFEIANDGSIASITLLEAQRGKGRDKDFAWLDLKGDCFNVMGKTIHSINVRYAFAEPTEIDDFDERIVQTVKRLARSFWYQEP